MFASTWLRQVNPPVSHDHHCPLGDLTALPAPSWWSGGWLPPPKNPTTALGPAVSLTSALPVEVSFASVETNPGYSPGGWTERLRTSRLEYRVGCYFLFQTDYRILGDFLSLLSSGSRGEQDSGWKRMMFYTCHQVNSVKTTLSTTNYSFTA